MSAPSPTSARRHATAQTDRDAAAAEADRWRALAVKNAAEAERLGEELRRAVADQAREIASAMMEKTREALRTAREEGVRAGIEAAALYVHDQQLSGLARQIRECVQPPNRDA